MTKSYQERWQALTPAERLKLIRSDFSMRHKRWEGLANRWALTNWDQMDSVNKLATQELFEFVDNRRA